MKRDFHDLLFVINTPEFFLSHRLSLAVAVRAAGFNVHVATGSGISCKEISDMGFVHHEISLSRHGRNPLQELRTMWEIFRLMRKIKPKIAHLVTIKPILYGTLMARLTGVPAVVVAVSGLGSVFVARRGLAVIFRRLVEMFYRHALKHPKLKAIFQNSSDRDLLIKLGAVCDEQTILIQGSGVNLHDIPVLPEPNGTPVVIFASRLLKDKGVLEFVDASRILKERGIVARFWLVGAPDPGNPSSVTSEDVQQWKNRTLIETFGYRSDVIDLFCKSNIVVLPSYYGEGLPKVLIEAAACGRAVVTTDHPGCRDAIQSNKTGLFVPVRNAVALANAIQLLIEDPVRRQQMGAAGRLLAERMFTIESVVDAHLKVYRELLTEEASGNA